MTESNSSGPRSFRDILFLFLVPVAVPLFMGLAGMWLFTKTADFKYAQIVDLHKVETRMSISEERYGFLCTSLGEIKGMIEGVAKDVREHTQSSPTTRPR